MSPELWIDSHIRLVPVSPKYRKDIFIEFTDDIVEFLLVEHVPEKIGETDHFISHAMDQMAANKDIVWVILQDDEFCGCCGIHNIPGRTPHFGIWLKTSKQGMGIGLKVTKKAMYWAVNTLDIDYVKYPVDENNMRSIRIIEKLTSTIYDRYKLGKGKVLKVNEYRIYPTGNNQQ